MTGYCHYCGSLIQDEDMIHTYDDKHRLKWTGCFPCYQKKMVLKTRPEPTRLTDVDK